MDIRLNQVIGKNLKMIRLAQGITQIELAQRLDTPQSFVSKVEIGERALRVYEVYWYADALGMSGEKLVSLISKDVKGKPLHHDE